MTDKYKNIALIVGFMLMLVISYVFSIEKTIDLKVRVTSLKKEKELLANAGGRIFNLQQQNRYLDSILQQKNISIENSFQQTLLNRLNSFSKEKSMEIISFKKPHIFLKNNTKTQVYSFEIKSDFSVLLQLVNYFERQQLGELVSINFEKKRNYRRNKDELTGKFYIKKLSQEK